jgi:hypothetical protein
MHIGLCGHQKETNNKWTYNHMDELMLGLETIIALGSTTYVVDLDAYELHLGMEMSSTTILINAKVVH